MDTYTKSIEISKEILSKYDMELSIQKGDENTIIANIDVNNKTITIPAYQEAMLILDETDSYERYVNLYLALKMLQNDDYDLCEELIDILESEGLPTSSNRDYLYRSILVKQLFILLHEVGHYMIGVNEEWKDLCVKTYREMIDEMEEVTFDEDEKSQFKSFLINAMQGYYIDDAIKDYMIEGLTAIDIKQNSKEYVNRMYIPEESYADVTAMALLNDYIDRLYCPGLEKSLKEAAMFLNNLAISERVIDISDDQEVDKVFKKYLNELLLTTLTRMYFLGQFSRVIFSDKQDGVAEADFSLYSKAYAFQRIILEKGKYTNSWCDGNLCEERDQFKYDELKNRINRYAESLTSLYQ